ncbi:hypothetical protein ACTXT7_001149 [Hymenolepis weldensis]
MSPIPSSHAVKLLASLKVPDPAAAEDFSKHKSANLAERSEKTRGRCLIRKLSPVEYKCYSKFVLPKDFDELGYSENCVDHGRSLWPELLSIQRLL